MFRRIIAPLSFVLVATGLFAQSLPTRWEVTLPNLTPQPRTCDLAVVDDLDGDGFAEVLVGVKDQTHDATLIDGFALLVSGADGSVIHTLSPPVVAHSFGLCVVALDDLDGDGLRDLGVLSHRLPMGSFSYPIHVDFFSCATGALLGGVDSVLTSPPAAPTLETVTDLDGDGIRELAICATAPSLGGGPAIQFVNPVTQTVVTFLNYATGLISPVGQATVARVDDRDGDGIEDLVIGRGGLPLGIPATSLTLHSGANLAPITSWIVPGAGSQYGQHCRLAGDVDRDGVPDVVVPDNVLQKVYVQNVDTGAVISARSLSGVQYFFHQASGTLGDADGDGYDDWYVIDDTAHIRVFSGRAGTEQVQWENRVNLGNVVRAVRAFGDWNGDGMDEFLVGFGAKVSMMSMVGLRPYGGTRPLDLTWRHFGLVGSLTGDLEVSGGAPLGSGMIAASIGAANLTASGFTLLIDATPEKLVAVAGFGFDASGKAAFGLNLSQPAIAGTSVHVQALETSPLLAESNGLELLFADEGMRITGITPRGVIGGETVTVSGSGFTSSVTLRVDGAVVPTTSVSPTSVSFVAPAGLPYGILVQVQNSTGEARTIDFNPIPVATLPVSQGPASGGNPIVISGGPFVPGTTVSVGGVAQPLLTSASTALLLLAPPGTVGPALITVNVPSATVAGGLNFNLVYTYL
ncbi:MAG: IPT/TIG domain-containing protein [Planctomycetota bacterium]